MPVNTSFGCFPSQAAVRSKSVGDINRPYFRTSYKDQLTGDQPPVAERAENFDAIHSIGKKTTRYMKYQKQTAQLLDRNACSYTKTYIAKPLGDCETNKALAAVFRGDHKPRESPSFGVKSNYREAFVGHKGEELTSAKAPSQAPKQVRTQTLGGTGDMLETVSQQHKSHAAPPRGLSALAGEIVIPKGNLSLCGQGMGELFRSQYGRDFKMPKKQGRMTEAEWQEVMPPAPSWVMHEPEIYGTRRACFLSPGN